MTSKKTKKEGSRGFLPSIPYDSPEEIERLLIASLIHSSFNGGTPADQYFRGKVGPGQKAGDAASLGEARRVGLSYNRFNHLRKNVDLILKY